MKKFLLLVMMMFSFGFVSAQYLVEDNDITENSKEFGRADISLDMNNPLEFYRLKCANATYAQYIGGESRNWTETPNTSITVGFEGASWTSENQPALQVAAALLGCSQ